jgi:hypothetical protein
MAKHFECLETKKQRDTTHGIKPHNKILHLSYEACHAQITIHLSIEWIASNTSNEYNIRIMEKKNPMLNVSRCTTSYLLTRLVYLWCLVFLTKCDWLNITCYHSKARLRRLTRWGLALWQPSSQVGKWSHEILMYIGHTCY